MTELKKPDYAYWPAQGRWFDMAYDLLNLANDCLADTPFGSPSEAYVSVDEPDFDCCDFISVHMQIIRPIQSKEGLFPEENFQQITNCGEIYWVPRFEITVGRDCKPLLDPSSGRSRAIPASAKDKSEYARNIYIDAETLSCCVTQKIMNGYKIANRTFNPQAVFPQQVYPETFGTCTRLRFRIMLDLDTCCIPHGKNGGRGYDDKDWVNRRLTDGPLGLPLPKLPSDHMMQQALGNIDYVGADETEESNGS